MEKETFGERLSSAAFSVGWNLVCRLPESVARALFNWGADIAWRRQGGGVLTLLKRSRALQVILVVVIAAGRVSRRGGNADCALKPGPFGIKRERTLSTAGKPDTAEGN